MSQDPNAACGACAGIDAETPQAHANAPGQPALRYRVGTQAQFLDSLLSRLSGADFPALSGLSTRSPEDPTVALLDAAATMADVVSFYQERIANESYLRTATERRSLAGLAALVGYAPAPGVAADTWLAFETEAPPGPEAPPVLPFVLESGTRVQSVPGQNEKPQTFETVETITARPEWNAIRPQLDEPPVLKLGQDDLYLAGLATLLSPGDALLMVGRERLQSTASERWDVRTVARVEADPLEKHTRVVFTEPLGSSWPRVPPASDEVQVYALRQRASLFGHNAPDPASLNLQAPVTSLVAGLQTQLAGLDQTSTASLFSRIDSIAASARSPLLAASGAWLGFAVNTAARTFDLDAPYPRILPRSWIVMTQASTGYAELFRVETVGQVSLARFGISAKVTRVSLSGHNFDKYADRRDTQVLAQSEELALRPRPLGTAVSGSVVALDRRYPELRPGQALAFADAQGAQIAHIDQAADAVTHDAMRTTLRLDRPLDRPYARASLRICANVARATHGETVSEIAGSGRAAQADQRFVLRQSPLTYVGSPRPEGCEATLEVRVNELRWNPVPTLFEQGPDARVYRITQDDEGRSTVQFGDGVEGARLPSGQDNVRLHYRRGLGVAGNLRAGSLSTLLSRPLGLKAVRNPVAASGGADAESREAIRTNAPISVLTLGRAVSPGDYADFARSFAGIAKSHALWVPYGPARGMHVTVAGPGGAAIPGNSQRLADLVRALREAGDPLLPLTVRTYARAAFEVKAKIRVAADALPAPVFERVRVALQARFSFEARAFGQPAALSEVIACMQACAGVVAVDVDRFRRSDAADANRMQTPSRLPAFLPQPDIDGAVGAAELLVLAPGSPELVLMP